MTVINFNDIALTDVERQPCEVWTRVMGYHRPVSEFNKGKKSEYYSRKCFVEEKCSLRYSMIQLLLQNKDLS